MLLTVLNRTPQIADSAWIAKNSVITGNVIIGEQSSIFFYTVIRGDVNQIRIGKRTNIQDGCIVHGSTGKQDTVIGDDVTIGHRAIIHGCVIGDRSLVGMGATILDDVTIESNVIVAAGSVVPPRMTLKSGNLYAGVPAKIIRSLNAEDSESTILKTAQSYIIAGKTYKDLGV